MRARKAGEYLTDENSNRKGEEKSSRQINASFTMKEGNNIDEAKRWRDSTGESGLNGSIDNNDYSMIDDSNEFLTP